MPMLTKALLRQCFILISIFAIANAANAQLSANFSATPTSGCSPQVVTFTDLSTGNPIEWKWDLGNGTTSVLQNPSATYFNAGQFDVTLIVKDAAGNSDTLKKIQLINVFAIPVVNFSASATAGCVPLTVQFTDLSTAGSSVINQWLWDFGDGTTSTAHNPSHIYTAAGNYNVTLRVSTTAGCSKTLTKTNYIRTNNGVIANFTNSSPTGCKLPITINFTNTSTGSGTLSNLWNFGDGNTSTATNPTHTYNSTGNFTVTLTVTSSADHNQQLPGEAS